MQSRHFLPPVLAVVFWCLFPSFSIADEAEDIFRRCVEHLEQTTRRCLAANEKVVRECVPQIKELLARGHRDQARALAERCINQIRSQSAECMNSIRRHCEECIQHLRELNAFELAERLQARCQEALTAIERSRNRSINLITGLF